MVIFSYRFLKSEGAKIRQQQKRTKVNHVANWKKAVCKRILYQASPFLPGGWVGLIEAKYVGFFLSFALFQRYVLKKKEKKMVVQGGHFSGYFFWPSMICHQISSILYGASLI